MYIVGLNGPPACGKTKFAEFLSEALDSVTDLPVIIADTLLTSHVAFPGILIVTDLRYQYEIDAAEEIGTFKLIHIQRPGSHPAGILPVRARLESRIANSGNLDDLKDRARQVAALLPKLWNL